MATTVIGVERYRLDGSMRALVLVCTTCAHRQVVVSEETDATRYCAGCGLARGSVAE